MSFDIFVQWFRDGESDTVDVASVREVLGEMVAVEDGSFWGLGRHRHLESGEVMCGVTCPDDPCEGEILFGADVYGSLPEDDPHRVVSLMINHVHGSAILDAIHELLSLAHGVCFWPDGVPYVAHEQAVEHLPPTLIEALGEPRVVTSGSALLAALEEP